MTSPRLISTPVNGCVVIDLPMYEDIRGTFAESYNLAVFEHHGLPTSWPQDSISSSHRGVVRGLHIQRNNPQGKYVRCLSGSIIDICLDLRPDSPTFKAMHMETITGNKGMYLPPGTAHGFVALDPRSVVYYKCTTLYDRESDGGVNPLDPALSIKWPWNDCILSEKDRNLPTLQEWLADPRGLK